MMPASHSLLGRHRAGGLVLEGWCWRAGAGGLVLWLWCCGSGAGTSLPGLHRNNRHSNHLSTSPQIIPFHIPYCIVFEYKLYTF